MSSEGEVLVAALAAEILDSFEKLEILLRLERGPAAFDALLAELGIDKAELATALEELVANDVVSVAPIGYTIVPDGRWAVHVRALSTLHRSDRMLVVTLMSKASMERLRVKAARAFADAFVLRPRRKGD